MMQIFNIITKILELFFIFMGLILVVIGWSIPYYQSKKMEKKHWKKKHIDNQIACFYGPITELLNEHRLLRLLIDKQLGQKELFCGDHSKMSDLSENDQKIWRHFVDYYKLPIHLKIVEIIRNNYHLIYKSDIPKCFRSYMEYVLGWELLDNQKKNDVPNYYEYHYIYRYPQEFDDYMNTTLAVLLKEQLDLMD